MNTTESMAIIFTFVSFIMTAAMPFMLADSHAPTKYIVAAMVTMTGMFLSFWLNERARRLEKSTTPSLILMGVGSTSMATLFAIFIHSIVYYVPAH